MKLPEGETTLEAAAKEAIAGHIDLPHDSLLNMELSSLSFNERVLALAADSRIPLLERMRFVSILGSNLDEFFMTRVAGFKQQIALGNPKKTLDGLTPQEQLHLITIRVRRLVSMLYEEVLPDLLKALDSVGIGIVPWESLNDRERAYLQRNYTEELHSVVAPLPVILGMPFPHIRNLRPALLVMPGRASSTASPGLSIDGDASVRVIMLTSEVPRLVPLPGGRRFVTLEEIVRCNLPRFLDGGSMFSSYLFRVTRSGNLRLGADEGGDVVGSVAENLAKRPFQPVVRLEVEQAMPEEVRIELLARLASGVDDRFRGIGPEDVYSVGGFIDLRRLEEIATLPIPELRYPRARRATPLREGPSIFAQIRRGDILVRFPRHSFEKTVERFIQEAATDSDVETIRITLYRTNRTSRIVKLLRRAHRRGKQVTAMIEVKASFDERRNIEWARALETAGIRVLYGPPTLKVHAKIASISRREGSTIRHYSYVGTGNLNAATAVAYTDLGLLTADAVVGEELEQVFAAIAGSDETKVFNKLIVAPFNMRSHFQELLEREIRHAQAGLAAGLTVKLNGIADRGIISALYRASQAGVRIDLIVRGICALRPGIPGLSERIRVVSLAGRYLEHSRIFRFSNAGEPEYFIGSADWRGRNLSRRVEVAVPVCGSSHRAQLDAILENDLANPEAWDMHPDGSYTRRTGERRTDPILGGRIARHSN